MQPPSLFNPTTPTPPPTLTLPFRCKKKFLTKLFSDLKPFIDKVFLDQNSIEPKIFSDLKNLLGQKNILEPKFLWIQILAGPKKF